ncbi:hypothetical protein [Adhaeretor mobilis]|uniref:Uncharacterized protein n=1 Tax=Adhaeretor mobilis TaxID=1930276 RepID=A0A517MRT8_9BACT|nr:hypothetical protein [Adhaeretor mobilis]QDS97590.1 hypothetical protein HG15A2_08530 [Adhaeretor mobilis]
MTIPSQPPDQHIAPDAAPPPTDEVRNYLLYTLSLPERAVRSSVGAVGGAVRESTGLLVPQAIRDSTTYSVLVQQTLDFLTEDVGGVKKEEEEGGAEGAKPRVENPRVENYVARKTVGNFVEMAGLATLHLSPLMVLAVVSDVAHGSQTYLKELAEELRREGIIDEQSTIDSTSDLLDALGRTSKTASEAFDTPPLSLEGLRETLNQTTTAAGEIDLTKALPQSEITRMWEEMQQLAATEEVSLLELSSAVTLHSLGKIANVGRGALSTVRVAGNLFDRHVLDHYSTALADIHNQGYYTTLAEVSGPYISALWENFSTEKTTITEELLSGRAISQATQKLGRWLGLSGEQIEEPQDISPSYAPSDSHDNATNT